THSVKQANKIYPHLHTRRKSRYGCDANHWGEQRGTLKLGQQDRFRLSIDQIDKMPGQGRATAEAEYIENYFFIVPSTAISSHPSNRRLCPVMSTCGPNARTQAHGVLRGLRAIRSVRAVNGAWSTQADPAIVAARAIVTI